MSALEGQLMPAFVSQVLGPQNTFLSNSALTVLFYVIGKWTFISSNICAVLLFSSRIYRHCVRTKHRNNCWRYRHLRSVRSSLYYFHSLESVINV